MICSICICRNREPHTCLFMDVISIQLSLIEESDSVRAILDSQSQQVRPCQLVNALMQHSIVTPEILKAHLTPGAFHMDGQLFVPIEGLQHGYGLQGREVNAPQAFCRQLSQLKAPILYASTQFYCFHQVFLPSMTSVLQLGPMTRF